MTHADSEFLILLGPTPPAMDGGGVFFETHAPIREHAGPLGPRRCAPKEAMAGAVARPKRLAATRMVFEWPSWWARV